MSVLSFRIRKKGSSVLIFSLHWGFRFFFFGLAVFLLTMLLMEEGTGHTNTGPFFFMILLTVMGSYHEAWIFDNERQSIVKQHGLIFLFFRKRISMDQLDSFHLECFTIGALSRSDRNTRNMGKGGLLQRSTCKLYGVLKDGIRLDIEMLKSSQYNQMKTKAEALADFCGKPVVLDSAGAEAD